MTIHELLKHIRYKRESSESKEIHEVFCMYPYDFWQARMSSHGEIYFPGRPKFFPDGSPYILPSHINTDRVHVPCSLWYNKNMTRQSFFYPRIYLEILPTELHLDPIFQLAPRDWQDLPSLLHSRMNIFLHEHKSLIWALEHFWYLLKKVFFRDYLDGGLTSEWWESIDNHLPEYMHVLELSYTQGPFEYVPVLVLQKDQTIYCLELHSSENAF